MAKSLRELRSEKLWSLRELADRSDTTAKTLVDIEHRRRTPTFRTMRRVSDGLGVEPIEIAEFAAAIRDRSRATR